MNHRRRIQAILWAGLGLVGFLAATASATASSRDDSIAALDALERTYPGSGVRVSVLGGEGGAMRIGDDLVYRFEALNDGYLTAVHVDTHGAMTLLYPRSNPNAGRIVAGEMFSLPGANDSFTLQAQPPIGRDYVYAVVTAAPITRSDLGFTSGDLVVSIEAHRGPDFVERLQSVLASQAKGEVRIAHVVQEVEGRGEVQYRSADIVGYFGERTRSIRAPKLDLQIHFGTDSATLDDKARRNIDEFAEALTDPKLADIRFKVAGHTDDTGSEAHNLKLSRQRADAVRQYLVEQGGIPADRLEIEAHGENAPLMSDGSDYARQMNRRVEFMPAR